MMKKLSLFIIALVLVTVSANAQDRDINPDAWVPNPHMHAIPDQYMHEHAVMLLYSEKRDFIFEGKGTVLYNTIHRLIKVLDRSGIESYNQVALPTTYGRSRIDSVKARVISPDGTVRNLKYEMLYLMGNGGLFFALDGLEKNAEIEIEVKYKEVSNFFGNIQFQHTMPVLNTYFEMSYPKEFTFITKGYHGFPSGEEQKVGSHKQIKIYKANIPALERQPYSFYDLYAMRLEYGIDHVTHWGGYQSGEEVSWNDLARDNYEEFYNIKESDKKAANAFLSTIGLRGGETESEKIKLIEDGIKSNIVKYWELSGKDAENVDTILARKSASEKGMVKLFCVCYKLAGVQHELGVTSDRTTHSIDLKFVNFNQVDDYVFYFPGTGKYLAPAEPYYRYPEIPYTMLGNKGIFCKTNPEAGFNVGKDVTTAEADIRTIDPAGANEKRDELNAEVTFNKDLDAEINLNYSYTGYSASDKRTTLAAADAKHKEDFIKDLVGFDVDKKPELLVKYNTTNEGFSDVYKKKPLVLNAVVRDPALIENAGNKHLLLVGTLMGSDEHLLYNNDQRIFPIDLKYPQFITRTLTINIPDGYKVLNAESLKLHSEHTDRDNSKTTASFSSDYHMAGNKLIITIKESYMQLHYPVAEYDRFKQVVNTAADFSKVALLLEKTGSMPKHKAKPITKTTKPVAKK